jgi:hypothetical protein
MENKPTPKYELTSASWSAREHSLGPGKVLVIIFDDGGHYLPEANIFMDNPEKFTFECYHPDTCPIHNKD